MTASRIVSGDRWQNTMSERPHAHIPELLTEREAAGLLRVKPFTIRAQRMRGKLGYTRIGCCIFYTERQLGEYEEKQSIPPCANVVNNVLARSDNTGSARSPAAMVPWGKCAST
jgi:hypothetical protein